MSEQLNTQFDTVNHASYEDSSFIDIKERLNILDQARNEVVSTFKEDTDITPEQAPKTNPVEIIGKCGVGVIILRNSAVSQSDYEPAA